MLFLIDKETRDTSELSYLCRDEKKALVNYDTVESFTLQSTKVQKCALH